MTNTWPVTSADRADPVEVAIAQRFADDGTLGPDEQMFCYMIVGRAHSIRGDGGGATEYLTWAACEGMDPREQLTLLEAAADVLRRRLDQSN